MVVSVAPLRLCVPMPISTNALYATVRGRRVKTAAARDYTAMVVALVTLWRQTYGDPPSPPYRLTIVLHPESQVKRPDVSNCAKLLEDSVFAGIKQNDRTVVELIVRLGEIDRRCPNAEVVLEHVEPAPPGAPASAQGEG